MPNNDLISRADVLDLMQPYGPATYDMPYGSGDICYNVSTAGSIVMYDRATKALEKGA